MKTNRRTLGQITSLDKRGTTDAMEIGALLIEAKEHLLAEGKTAPMTPIYAAEHDEAGVTFDGRLLNPIRCAAC